MKASRLKKGWEPHKALPSESFKRWGHINNACSTEPVRGTVMQQAVLTRRPSRRSRAAVVNTVYTSPRLTCLHIHFVYFSINNAFVVLFLRYASPHLAWIRLTSELPASTFIAGITCPVVILFKLFKGSYSQHSIPKYLYNIVLYIYKTIITNAN